MQANAAQILGERAAELAAACYRLEDQAELAGAGEILDRLAARLADLPQGPQPINIQIAAQRWREDMAVDAAAAIEARVGQMCLPLWDKMGA